MPRFRSQLGRVATFRQFTRDIAATDGPALHFLHVMLPHTPWRFLPSGSTYEPYRRHGDRAGHRWPESDWWVVEAWQRHLLQVGFVDRLLGELLEHLDEIGLYDRCLLVVTADHGMGFWPGESGRELDETRHPEDILSIPLFIKRPGEHRSEPSLANVELIDVLPTIVEVLGAEPGWHFDGCSVFDATCPERTDKRAFTQKSYAEPDANRSIRFPADVALRTSALDRKHEIFGSDLHRFGPYAALVGRDPAEFVGDPAPAGQVVLGDPTSRVPANETPVPVRVSGVLQLGDTWESADESARYVAIALAGRIRTVVAAPHEREQRQVVAMLPEAVVAQSTAAQPELYLITGSPTAPSLRPLSVTTR